MPTDTALRAVVDSIDETTDGGQTDGGQFAAVEGAQIRCFSCDSTFPASECSADVMTRLEGTSDPGDMMMVVPVTCPRCDAHGSLTLHYGPESTVEESDTIVAMSRNPTAESAMKAAENV